MGPYIWASAAVFLAFLTLVQTVSVCASPSHPQHVPRVSHVARSLVAPKHGASQVTRRQSQARNQTVVTSPAGVRIRYKEITGQVCELSEGVRSFSGYVDLSGNRSTYFTLFEARTKPQTAPITLWLSGNPGQDSLTGLYQSLGPCRISADLEPVTIKDSWTEHSNMIFLSQPTSVGFSSHLGDVRPKIADGTTQEATTEVLEAFQAIVAAMPQIDDRIKSTDFHLATDSYGGYYGPAFLRYFCQQNRNELRGQSQATSLVMKSLTLLSGWIDDYLQNAYYPIFANNNTLSLKFYNDTMYGKVAKAYGRSGGCKDQIQACRSNGSASLDVTLCSAAVQVCYEEVERPFYDISGRSPSNIALATNEGDLPKDFVRYLNLPSVQAVLGMHDKYTSKPDILEAFTGSTQFASGSFRRDLENLIDSGVRVSLAYGDAQYRTNWLGGEAVSLALDYGGADQFRAAPYMPFVVEGIQYGETRSFGGLSFTRIDQSGAQIPFYQPLAARTLFQRVVGGLAIADGGQLPSPTRAQSCEMPDQVEGTENLGLSTVMSKGTPLSTSRGFSSTQSSVTASANEADMPVGTTSLEEVAVINASSTSKTNPKITGILGGEGLTITEVSPEGPPSAEPSEGKGGARLRMGTFGRHRWISMVLPATLCILL